MSEPVFTDILLKRVVATPQKIAKAQELLCPRDNAELRDLSNPTIGMAQCMKCGTVYVWRLTP